MLYFFVTAVVRTTDLSELKKQELSVGGKCVNDLCREVCRCVLGKGQPCLECSEYACTLSKVFLWHFSRLVDICKCYVLQKRLQQQTEGSRCKFWFIRWKYVCGTGKLNYTFYVYWNVHHLDSWIKIDQLDVTCFIISLVNAQHVSNVSASILRSLRLICWVISWVVLLWFDVCWCYGVVRLGWKGTLMQSNIITTMQSNIITTMQSNTTHEITQQISRKLLRMDVLTFETCWALNNEIIKQVTSS